MIRPLLGGLLTLISFQAVGCSCGKSFFSTGFLGQVKSFDHVVQGTFLRTGGRSDRLVVEKVYKGKIKQDTIQLGSGGLDCFLSFDFPTGTRLLVGLINSPYPGSQDIYFGAGCVTSALVITHEGQVRAPDKLIPLVSKSKISLVRRTMKLRKLERKIERKSE